MLAIARVSDRHSDDCRSPVTHETLSACVENRLAADSLCTSAIYLTMVSNRQSAEYKTLTN